MSEDTNQEEELETPPVDEAPGYPFASTRYTVRMSTAFLQGLMDAADENGQAEVDTGHPAVKLLVFADAAILEEAGD